MGRRFLKERYHLNEGNAHRIRQRLNGNRAWPVAREQFERSYVPLEEGKAR